MTQAYIDGLLALAVAQARAVKIPVSRDICPQVRLNRRARTRFGCCIRREGRYTIELSAKLAEEGREEAVLQVLAHEVLHTCWGCSNHGARWKGYAQRMNEAYGYHIRRTDNYDKLGIEDDRPVRYWVVCARSATAAPAGGHWRWREPVPRQKTEKCDNRGYFPSLFHKLCPKQAGKTPYFCL